MTRSIAYEGHHIKCYSEGKGEVLIFLHGWPTNARLWKSQIEVLKKHYRTMSIDWLGFGESDKPKQQHYTFTKKKEILDAVLAAILPKNEPINIIAHDVGGPPAILWSHENQDRVNRLILLNTVLFPFSTALDKISHLFFNLPIFNKVLVSQFGLRTLMKTLTTSRGGALHNRIEEVLEGHENWESELRLKTILEPLSQGRKKELLLLAQQFKALRVNRYLIIARNDPLCFAHMKKISLDNPDLPTYHLKHCGHFIPIDKPEELNEILAGILEKEHERE